MTERNFKSTQTRCKNKHQKLVESLPELYKERRSQMTNLNYFYSKKDDELIHKLDIQELNEARASILLKIANLDKRIEFVCLKIKENHQKYMSAIKKYKPETVYGFRASNAT